jgi:phage portal protein BeeE/intein/homing endonuclease
MFQKVLSKFGYEKKGAYDALMIGDYYDSFSFSANPSIGLRYYSQIAPVGDAISKIASEASAIRLLPYEKSEEGLEPEDDNPFVKKFSKPNFQQTGIDFRKEAFIHYLATGNNYIYLSGVLNATRDKIMFEPNEVFNLRPDFVTAVAGSNGYVDHYYYTSNGTYRYFTKRLIRNFNNELIEAFVDDKLGVLVHFKEPSTNPINNCLYGDSPLQSVELEMNQYLQASIHNTNLLKNGMSSKMMFSPKEGTNPPNPEQLQKVADIISKRYSGTNNAGNTILIGMPFTAVPLDMNLKDMDFEKLMRRMRVAIYNNFNVSLPSVEGEFAAAASTKEANLYFYDKAVLPLLDKYCDFYYHFIYQNFYPQERIVKIGYDKSSIMALQVRMFESISTLKKGGVFTINEIRKYMDRPKTDVGGNAVYIDGNQVAVAGDEGENFGVPANGMSQGIEDNTEEDAEDDNMEEEKSLSLVPSETMARNAARGLELREKYGRGGTSIGVARANQLKSRENLTPKTIGRMVSYFARHGVNEGKNKRPNGEPTNHYISWCLTHDTEILLADGSLETIGNIVNNKMDVQVMSKQEDGSIKPAKISNWLKLTSSQDDFMVLRRGKAKSNECGVVSKPKLYATKEHPIFTGNEYTQMQNLKTDNKVAVVEEFVDNVSEQIALGHIMGDAYLSSSGQLKISRCNDQLEYLEDTIKLTKNLGWCAINSFIAKTGFGVGKTQHRTSSKSFRYLLENSLIRIENKKRIVVGDLDKLNDIAVSRWILDDGSLHKGNGLNAKPNYRLHIEGYDEESAFKIAKWFESKYQGTLNLHKRENCNGFVIYFGVDMTQDIAQKIAKYIPYSMRYKLVESLRDTDYVLENHICQTDYKYLMQEINYIRNAKNSDKNKDSSKFDYRYDLTIEGTHNFIANSVIVHNCLWGGNSGRSWANSKWRQIQNAKD